MNPLALNPLVLLGAGTLALALGFGSGWAVNGWRLDADHQRAEAAHAQALQVAKAESLDRERDLANQRDKAIENANSRDQTIRALAAASGGANVGLRDTLAAISRGVPSATVDSLGKSVATLSTVLAECSGRYQGLAEKADRHASDVKTLQNAWPQNAPAKQP